jgi:hypothetical protein
MVLQAALRLPISSRRGNWTLLVVGAVIAVAALALLVYSLATTWGYSGRMEQLVRLVLVFEIVAGAAIAFGARRNLTG